MPLVCWTPKALFLLYSISNPFEGGIRITEELGEYEVPLFSDLYSAGGVEKPAAKSFLSPSPWVPFSPPSPVVTTHPPYEALSQQISHQRQHPKPRCHLRPQLSHRATVESGGLKEGRGEEWGLLSSSPSLPEARGCRQALRLLRL